MDCYFKSNYDKEVTKEKSKVGLNGNDLLSHLISSSSSSSSSTTTTISTTTTSSSWNQYKTLTVDSSISNNRRLQKSASELKGWSVSKDGIKKYTTFRNGKLVEGTGRDALKLALGDGAIRKKENKENNNDNTNEKRKEKDNNNIDTTGQNINGTKKRKVEEDSNKGKIHGFFKSL